MPVGWRASVVLGAAGVAICLALLGSRTHLAAAHPTVSRPDWDAQLSHARQLDINAASQAELERLPGVGPSLAHAIMETREREGWFESVEGLIRVRGIGPELLRRLQPYVRVDEAPQE